MPHCQLRPNKVSHNYRAKASFGYSPSSVASADSLNILHQTNIEPTNNPKSDIPMCGLCCSHGLGSPKEDQINKNILVDNKHTCGNNTGCHKSFITSQANIMLPRSEAHLMTNLNSLANINVLTNDTKDMASPNIAAQNLSLALARRSLYNASLLRLQEHNRWYDSIAVNNQLVYGNRAPCYMLFIPPHSTTFLSSESTFTPSLETSSSANDGHTNTADAVIDYMPNIMETSYSKCLGNNNEHGICNDYNNQYLGHDGLQYEGNRSNILKRINQTSPLKMQKSSLKEDQRDTNSYCRTNTIQVICEKYSSFTKILPLSISEDNNNLISLHCFVRRYLVGVFCTSEEDIEARGRQGMIVGFGQIGLCCQYCRSLSRPTDLPKGSMYYPSSLSRVYNATMNLLHRHIEHCKLIPEDVREEYNILKSDPARSGYSKKYWFHALRKLGLVDTANGIRFVSSMKTSFESTSIQAIKSSSYNDENACDVVTPDDKVLATDFVYYLMKQMQRCIFKETDRMGKRNACHIGYPGLACKYCSHKCGSGRFFPSQFKTFSDLSKTIKSMYNHMLKCRSCPESIKQAIITLEKNHEKQKAGMKFGQIKMFLSNVWNQLHECKEADLK